jgi:hypothetical protein
VLFAAAGCATAEKREESAPVQTKRLIDLVAIQHDLDLDVSSDWTGYREKRFDACRWKDELPNISQCERAFFIQVGLQFSCRPTEEPDGSMILKENDLTPVGDRQLTWQLGEASGKVRTNLGGTGLFQAITSRSMKAQSIRVSTGVDFLRMQAGQATNIVVPVSWCR